MASNDVSTPAIPHVDMINATSKLQIEAAEIRSTSNKPNWTSYLRSQIIPQEEYNFISAYEAARNRQERDEVLHRDPNQAAHAMISLINDVAKDQIIRYILTVFDDMLQVRFCYSKTSDFTVESVIVFFYTHSKDYRHGFAKLFNF